jgi:hypothetical protein
VEGDRHVTGTLDQWSQRAFGSRGMHVWGTE